MNIAGIEYITVVDHNRAIFEKSFKIEELNAARERSARIIAALTQEIKDLRQELEDSNIHVNISVA